MVRVILPAILGLRAPELAGIYVVGWVAVAPSRPRQIGKRSWRTPGWLLSGAVAVPIFVIADGSGE